MQWSLNLSKGRMPEFSDKKRSYYDKIQGECGKNNRMPCLANLLLILPVCPVQIMKNCLFEFQVHQIELELQNEELKRTYHELSVSHDDFARIYNLSPIAYLTVNEQGIIKKANIVATQLLSCSKESLVNKKLGKFIHPSDQDNYYLFIRDLVVD